MTGHLPVDPDKDTTVRLLCAERGYRLETHFPPDHYQFTITKKKKVTFDQHLDTELKHDWKPCGNLKPRMDEKTGF